MANLTVELDGDAIREATTQAILGILTPEMKAKLLEKAINHILAPSTNSWDKGTTPLEQAFQNAVLRIAQEEAHRLIKEDEKFVGELKTLLRAAAEKVIKIDLDKMANKMADAFVYSLRER